MASADRDEQRQEDAELVADRAADEVHLAIDEAIRGAKRTIVPMATSWPTPDEYQSIWIIALTSLPGDVAIQTVVQVPAEDLPSFVAAEEAADPEFAIEFLNPEPPAAGHVITARTSVADARLVGVDHSSFEGSDALLERATLGSPSFNGVDMRKQATTVPGQIQVVMAHQVPFPDVGLLNAWTIVQIDAAAVIDEASSLSRELYGITVTSPINPEIVSLGVGADDAIVVVNRFVDTGDVELEIQVRSDGAVPGLADPVRALVIGGTSSFIAAALVAAAMLLLALMRRVDRSETQARRDDLTGLPNRRWVLEHLAQVGQGDVAVLFCDLDRFKVVNDSAGHSIGDQLLEGVASRIDDLVGAEHMVARFGGDEFIVVCEPVAGRRAIDAGSEVAQLLVDAMSEPFDVGTNTFRASLSIGVAAGPVPDRAAVDELIRQADTALAKCKRGGRNGYGLYDTQLRDAEVDRLDLEQELQIALDRGEMTIFYQPLVDESQKIYSFEALVRWRRNGTLVPPDRFLPVVADMGRMEDLGVIVRSHAIAQIADWSRCGRFDSNITMHVNVHASELINPAFPDLVMDQLAEHQVSPCQLVLEITEDRWLDVDEGNLEVFDRLVGLGLGLAIDDFGTGYSSISRILNLHGLSELKIDRSLVCQIDHAASRALIVGLVEIGRALDVTVVAEGVETIEEHRALLSAGITRFQGYLFGRPAPAELGGLPSTGLLPSPIRDTESTARR